MKKQVVVLAAALLLIVSTLTLGQPTQNGDEFSRVSIENYLRGLNSTNDGLRLSCAYFIGEYKIDDGIIPLMAMLHKDKTEGGRIMAALSLTKIGTDKSIFAVKQAAQFDESARVRNFCLKFYNHNVMQAKNKTEKL